MNHRKPTNSQAINSGFMRPYHISAFWRALDDSTLSLTHRSSNTTQMALFTFDVVNSLNDKERDFLIHARLAHLPSKQILKLIKQSNTGLPYSGKFAEMCRPCLEARHKAHNKNKFANRNANGNIGEHLHSDLAIVSTRDFNGFKYVLTIVDEISAEVVVVLLKDKTADSVLNACKRAHALITSRARSTLRTWQFHRGSEFMNKQFDNWIHSELGAKQLFSNVEHPWENGIAERSFQTIFTKARAMMKHADLPNGTWGKAVLHAVFLKTRSLSSKTDVSPYHFRTGSPFNFGKVRVSGCPAQIYIRPSSRLNPKFSARSEQGVFLGMSSRGNGYIFLVKRTNSVLEVDSTDVLFNETFSDCRDRQGRTIPRGAVLQPDLHADPVPDDELPIQDGVIAPKGNPPLTTSNRFEALTQAQRYNDASVAEFNGMKHKNVMELVPRSAMPSGTVIYPSVVNWTTKKVLGVYSKTKCRICFGGHRYDKTYTDCFAPTVNFNNVLMVICFAAIFGWHMGSLDYSQAYLNADIDELCVMRAPTFLREYTNTGEELFWKLNKVIYGHPKGSRLWADCLHKKLTQLGFHQFQSDQCVYGKWNNWDKNNVNNKSTITIILVHSDDLIITSNQLSMLNETKKQLLQAFDGVDQGDLTSFCGVEIDIKQDSISLSMNYYWKKLMQKFGISPTDTEDTPIRSKVRRSECPPEADRERKSEFLQIIGSILYGYTHCRLDLAYAVGMMTRVMHSFSA
jgi:hypothetical protein